MRALAVALALFGCAHGPEMRLGSREVEVGDPLAPQDHIDLGRALALAGDLDGAQRELEVAAAAAPQDPRPDRYLGDALLRSGHPSAAEQAYRRSIERRATPEALNNLAVALTARGAAHEAAALATRAVALETDAARRRRIEDTLARALAQPEQAQPDDGLRWARLQLAGRTTMVIGGCLFGTGLALLATRDDAFAGTGLAGGGALMIGLGAGLDHYAEKQLTDQARTVVVPLAVGRF